MTFSGGHDIGVDDRGRPCVLIAAALGVETEVFRSTPPKVKVKGFEKTEFVVTLKFDKNLKKNGGIKSIAVKNPESK